MNILVQKTNHLSGRTRCIFYLLLWLCFAPAAMAGVYKWVDEQGNINYSDTIPAEAVQSEPIRGLPKPQKTPTNETATEVEGNWQERLRILKEEQAAEKQQELAEQAKEEKERKQNCATAQKKFTQLQRPRINSVSADGERVRIGEDERQAEIQRVQKYIRENCTGN